MAVQRLGDVAVGTVVKVKESGKQAEFIVIQQGSPSSAYVGFDNGTVLFRKAIHSKGIYGSSNNYSSSQLNSWSNGTYLNTIDENIRNQILSVKIPYRPGRGTSTTVSSGNNGLSCKVFSLSVTELNQTSIGNAQEGVALEYFKTDSDSENKWAKGDHWWLRSPVTDRDYTDYAHYVDDYGGINGSAGANRSTYSNGRCPAFVLPQSLYVQDDGTIITNAPPTAPGSITADNVIGNQQAAITLTAATDPDGSVASYTYERQVDGGGWTVFATTSALTRTDPVDDSWTTVAYRAKATDNLGLSGPYATSQTYTVVHNLPPTAPGSIAVTGVVRGENAAITLTAATDPDGTVASYIFERQVDGGAWQQVAQVNSLTQTDTIGEDWGTVAYRACAVDNLGLAGPYITGETYTVNSGWVTIGGPAEDMGRQPRRFDFAFSVSVSGVASVDAITVSVARDGTRIYSGTPSAGAKISVPVDARLLGAGEHVIEVQASKDDYLPASRRYTFTVPAATIPDGGYGAISQASDGKTMFYTTLAQRCIGTGGVDIQAQVDALTARVKTLEG